MKNETSNGWRKRLFDTLTPPGPQGERWRRYSLLAAVLEDETSPSATNRQRIRTAVMLALVVVIAWVGVDHLGILEYFGLR